MRSNGTGMCCSAYLFGLYADPWNEATDICTRFPPKRVQNVASALLGIEALAGSLEPPQRSLVSQL